MDVISVTDRIRNAWDAFRYNKRYDPRVSLGPSNSSRPDRYYSNANVSKSIVSSIYNQIAVDASVIEIRHVKLNDSGRYLNTIEGSLNDVLNRSANLDQTGTFFIRDAILTMLEEGSVVLIPTVCNVDPLENESFKVEEARVGKVTQWFPEHVQVEVYNNVCGRKDQLILPKRIVPIIENPFYMTMNASNSLAKRLIRVLNQLDRTNEQNSSGKLDLIVQLPYGVKNQSKRNIAEERRKDLEDQLTGSAHGIAWIDSTEKVIQLNRSVDNNLWTQAKELQDQLYNQLGLSQTIFDGTADEQTMLNYTNRTLEPILSAFVEEIERKWLTKTARTQKQAIRFFRDPFKLVPVAKIAEIADKFTRNEIMTSNEIRAVIGMIPSADPKADQLLNSNLNHTPEEQAAALNAVDKEGASTSSDKNDSDSK